MNSINLYQNYLSDSLENTKPADTKVLVDEIFDLYKKDIISEKSLKFFIEALFASFIENKFNEKFLPKIYDLDNKMAISLLKLGKHYGGK